jgi:hypothetical protein
MTDDEAIALARQVAEVEGWDWLDPVVVRKEISRRSTRDRRVHNLVVCTNAAGADCNIWVTIDPATGSVLDGCFHGGRTLPVGLAKWKEGSSEQPSA